MELNTHDANEPVQTADVAGSISFSKVTIQASKELLKIIFLKRELNSLQTQLLERLYLMELIQLRKEM